MLVYVNKSAPKPKMQMMDILGFAEINKNIKGIMNDIQTFHRDGKLGERLAFPFNITGTSTFTDAGQLGHWTDYSTAGTPLTFTTTASDGTVTYNIGGSNS